MGLNRRIRPTATGPSTRSATSGERSGLAVHVRLKKGRDGPDSLACVREDGTSTWRRIQRGLAFHDLAHYAVETELGIRDVV